MQRHRAIHPGRAAARHADRRGRASAALRRQGEALRRRARPRLKGVADVVQIPSGVAVLATRLLGGQEGPRRAEGRVGRDRRASSSAPPRSWRSTASSPPTPGTVARKDGDAATALAGAAKKVEATYDFPYLAHAAMEPLNCVVRLDADGCEVWNGEQIQTVDQKAVARRLGLKPEQVKLNMLYAGGSFGRRAESGTPTTCSRPRPSPRPWRCGKPGAGQADLDARGRHARRLLPADVRPRAARRARHAGQRHRLAAPHRRPVDPRRHRVRSGDGQGRHRPTSRRRRVHSALRHPQPARSSCTRPRSACRCSWWRSVGSTHTAYSTEAFVDELAAAAGKDPVAFRRALLGETPAPRRRARARGRRRPAGASRSRAGKAGEKRGRGVAVHESFNTFVAQVAEVTVKDRRQLQRRPRRLRGRLRHRRQSGQRARADGRRHRLRPVRRAVRRDHAHGRRGRAVQLPRLPAAAHQRDADDRGPHRAVGGQARPASASPACRRSRRRSPTPSPRPRASGCASCRSRSADGSADRHDHQGRLRMHTPAGFVPGHALPAVLPAAALAFVWSGDQLLVAGGEGAGPRGGGARARADARNAGSRRHRRHTALPRRARRQSLRRAAGSRRHPGATRLALRRPALAVLRSAGGRTGARRAQLPDRRMGPHASLVRRLRDRDARQGRRAREGVPGVRPRLLSARVAGDDGAGHARPRGAARPRAPLSARHVQRAGGIRRARRDDRGLHPARGARGSRGRGRRTRLLRQPVVGRSRTR